METHALPPSGDIRGGSPEALEYYRAQVERGEPIQYLTGQPPMLPRINRNPDDRYAKTKPKLKTPKPERNLMNDPQALVEALLSESTPKTIAQSIDRMEAEISRIQNQIEKLKRVQKMLIPAKASVEKPQAGDAAVVKKIKTVLQNGPAKAKEIGAALGMNYTHIGRILRRNSDGLECVGNAWHLIEAQEDA